MKYGYIRTVPSDKTNSLEMQVEILQTVPGILFFIDKCGIDGNKKELNRLLSQLRHGDEVYITEFSRIAKNAVGLMQVINKINMAGATLISTEDGYNTSNEEAPALLDAIKQLSLMEKAISREKKRVFYVATMSGKYSGRNRHKVDFELFNELFTKYSCKNITLTEFARQLKVSRPTAYKMIAEYTDKNIDASFF